MMKWLNYILLLGIFWFAVACEGDSDNAHLAPNQQGQGGSLARFTLGNGFLYLVDSYQLLTFDLSDPMSPEKVHTADIGWDVETIFAMDQLLFIGTQSGMHIYEINAEGHPEFLSTYEHIVSCDPVVAQDTLAYVTLRSENLCRDGADVLEVIDIRDLQNPEMLYQMDMINPHGLGIRDSLLFITEGAEGLKVFDVNAADDLEELSYIPEIKAFDVIPQSNLLIVTGPDGIYQYDYSDPENLRLLSTIPVIRE